MLHGDSRECFGYLMVQVFLNGTLDEKTHLNKTSESSYRTPAIISIPRPLPDFVTSEVMALSFYSSVQFQFIFTFLSRGKTQCKIALICPECVNFL